MKIFALLGISLHLLRSKWKRNVLVFCGLLVGSFFFFTFIALTAGLQKFIFQPVKEKLQVEIIVAVPRSAEASTSLNPLRYLRTLSQENISPQIEAKIRALSEVRSVAREVKIPFPVATTARLFLGI